MLLYQIGIADDHISVSPTQGDGVGDDSHSWAFDGARSCVWHDGIERPYGKGRWSVGDIVGVFVEVSAEKAMGAKQKGASKRGRESTSEPVNSLSIGFSLNGVYLGDAFLSVRNTECPSNNFYPVISVESDEAVRLNIGQRPFQFYRESISEGIWSKGASPSFQPVLKAVDEDIAKDIQLYMAFYSGIESGDIDATVQNSLETDAETTISASCDQKAEEKADIVYSDIDIDASEFSSAECFHRFGMAHLKIELERRELKSGGTLVERAQRLFAVRGLPADKIDKKYRAKIHK